MKKTTILLTIIFLLIGITQSTCFAQETREKQEVNAPRFGIKGGINFSDLYTKDADKSKITPGFNLGLFGKLPITNYIAVQPELYFTTKGAEVTYNNSFVDGTARFGLNYLEVPVLLVVNITDNFNVQVGPYAALLISSKVTNKANISSFDFEENLDGSDFNRLDTGIAIGAGLDIGAISLGARYNYGFSKVGKEQTILGTTYTIPDAKNGVINFYISFSLN